MNNAPNPVLHRMDFAGTEESLINFLRSQDDFRDMNFDGSAIRALVRLLAYDTTMRTYANNYTLNELNLKTAQHPNNVNAFASGILGYVPQSKRGAVTTVNVIVTPPEAMVDIPTKVTMGRDTTFFGVKDNMVYQFSPLREYSAARTRDLDFEFADVQLVQGKYATQSFVVQSSGAVETFELSNSNIDISTLRVIVFENAQETNYTTWSKHSNGFDLGVDKAIYYLRMNSNGKYAIEFGDGKFSKGVGFGNVIVVEYLVTDGVNGNQIPKLACNGAIGGMFDVVVTTQFPSMGGVDTESMESVKVNAPMFFASQGRAVVDADYITKVKDIFPDAADVVAWGGEHNMPSKAGYTFVAVKPKTGMELSKEQRQYIERELTKYCVGSITPIVVSPNYTYVDLNVAARYNTRQTVLQDESMRTKIIDNLRIYSGAILEHFDSKFEHANATNSVNKTDRSITGNTMVVSYRKTFTPTIGMAGNYTFDMGRSIKRGAVSITGFRMLDANAEGVVHAIEDDGKGVLNIMRVNEDGFKSNFAIGVGTVDYVKGIIRVAKFNPLQIIDRMCSVHCEPDTIDQSIGSSRDSFLSIGRLVVDVEGVSNVG